MYNITTLFLFLCKRCPEKIAPASSHHHINLILNKIKAKSIFKYILAIEVMSSE